MDKQIPIIIDAKAVYTRAELEQELELEQLRRMNDVLHHITY